MCIGVKQCTMVFLAEKVRGMMREINSRCEVMHDSPRTSYGETVLRCFQFRHPPGISVGATRLSAVKVPDYSALISDKLSDFQYRWWHHDG